MEVRKRNFSIWYLLAAVLTTPALQFYVATETVTTLAYSDFKALFKAGKVRSATVGETAISGTLATAPVETILPADQAAVLQRGGRPERAFTTARVSDPGLLADLDAAHARSAGQSDARWLGTLLSWIVPVAAFLAIWSLLFRRIGTATSGLMEIGKSKAKVYLQQETGVTFADVAGIDEAQVELMEVVDFLKPEILDAALLRPGRFDRHIVLDRPDLKGRKQILGVHVRQVRLAPAVQLRELAARTPGFAGADLANLVNEAARLAARHNKPAVDMTDFARALDRIIGGLEKRNRIMIPLEKQTIACHEAGRALVAECRRHADRVSRISIIPRGVGALGYTQGYTQQTPTEDRYLLRRSELLDRLDVLLDGRVAAQIVVDDVSTGAQNDLERATDMARQMITQYGMSESLGLPRAGSGLLPSAATLAGHERKYRERTAQTIDEEIRGTLAQSAERARQTLLAQRERFDRLAHLLLKKEVVDRAAFDALMQAEGAAA
ncbi:hypothetical protein PO002_34855 [Cupriavidus necator]|uniref:hypothetical protein n=1 Tax=Cupriavidus necator TaxID=106590 RepID=UPI0039C4C4B3